MKVSLNTINISLNLILKKPLRKKTWYFFLACFMLPWLLVFLLCIQFYSNMACMAYNSYNVKIYHVLCIIISNIFSSPGQIAFEFLVHFCITWHLLSVINFFTFYSKWVGSCKPLFLVWEHAPFIYMCMTYMYWSVLLIKPVYNI